MWPPKVNTKEQEQLNICKLKSLSVLLYNLKEWLTSYLLLRYTGLLGREVGRCRANRKGSLASLSGAIDCSVGVLPLG